MWPFKKKQYCEHEWHELSTTREMFDIGVYYPDYEYMMFSYIYCPKCDSRKKVKEGEWKRIEKSQQIKAEYRKGL